MASIERFVQTTQAFDPDTTSTLGKASTWPVPCVVTQAIANASLRPRRQVSAIRFACETQDWPR
jgi:hypothetical protein